MGNNPYYPDEGDIIWCVFDRDDNSEKMLSDARDLAEKAGYKIAFSNPSFEIWFLLHFHDQISEVRDCDEAIHLLKQKGRLEDYKKNRDFYEILKPLQNDAVKRAKKRIEALEADNRKIISRESNPVTTVVELVEYLNRRR